MTARHAVQKVLNLIFQDEEEEADSDSEEDVSMKEGTRQQGSHICQRTIPVSPHFHFIVEGSVAAEIDV